MQQSILGKIKKLFGFKDNYIYIKDNDDYSHLSDKNKYINLYNEVGTVEANKQIVWREEWMKYFTPKSDSLILELGSHNGPNLFYYASQGHTIHGVELSDTLLETFYKRYQKEPESIKNKIQIYKGWIEEFIPSEKYDYVLCTEILEHVIDPVSILKVAQKSLKPDGRIYVSSPSTHWGNNTHVRGVTTDDLVSWMKQAELIDDKIWEEDERIFGWLKLA